MQATRRSRMMVGCIGMTVAAAMAASTDAWAGEEELLKRIKVLEERIAELEARVPPGDVVTSEGVTETALGFVGSTEISGFVSASYFYNFNTPDSNKNTCRGFDVRHNEFMIINSCSTWKNRSNTAASTGQPAIRRRCSLIICL